MSQLRPDSAALKRAAAAKALDFVQDGMKLGLGTGSTAEAFVELLAVRIRDGLNVTCTPTSERTAQKASALGIDLELLDDLAPLDVTVDGTDEADGKLDLIKGGGGALLREKIVAASSRRMVVIADETKLVRKLGKFPLPIEVVDFGHKTTLARIRAVFLELGYNNVTISQRMHADAAFRTDGGNLIYDCGLDAIQNSAKLAAAISGVTGVVEHGLFVGIARTLVIGRADGVEVIERPAN